MLSKNFFPSILVIFIITLELVLIGIGSVDGIGIEDLEKKKEDKEDIPNQVKYDETGVLVINGTFNGTTDPIVVDRKPLMDYCNHRPYYVFRICPESKEKMLDLKVVCPDGITFCYESQLAEGRVKEPFVLHRIESDPFYKICRDFSGFKVAYHFLPEGNDKFKESGFLFLEVTTSFTDKSYFFPLPPNSTCLDLYLGNELNILTGVRSEENDNQWVRPVQVRINNTLRGFHYGNDEEKAEKAFKQDFASLPHSSKMQFFSDAPHLKMLYMDFRARLYAPQMMMASIPVECNLQIKVTGNVVKKCQSDWKQKNVALRSYNDNVTWAEYTLIIETGTEDWKTSGRKKSTSKSSLRSTEKGGSTTNEDSRSDGLTTGQESFSRVSDTHVHEESSGTRKSSGVGVAADATAHMEEGGFSGDASLKAEAGIGTESSNSVTDRTSKWMMQEDMRRSSETTITSTSTILENAYRETSTSIDAQIKHIFNSQTVGILKKTIFKWIVKVPPNKLLMPMQQQMDCDGAGVKIPWLKFEVKDDDGSLPLESEGEAVESPDAPKV